MDDAGPQSLFVVVDWDSVDPYSSSIIQLETQVHKHEYASSANTPVFQTEFSAHIPRLHHPPQVQRMYSWAVSLPPASSTEDLYILPNWGFKKSENENVVPLPGFILNLSTKKCEIISPHLAPKYISHVVTTGDHIYYMSQPARGGYSPYPRFERYDTLSHSWEEREPLPLFNSYQIPYTGYIVGTAVLDEIILYNIDRVNETDRRKMWAYNVVRNKWYPVIVSNNLCYNILGVSVVLNKIIYALTNFCNSIVALTLKSQEIEGDHVFTCDLYKEYVVPGMKQINFEFWDSYWWTKHLVHLGKDNFCVVQSCNQFGGKNQYIQLTNIQFNEKKSIVTNICIHEFKMPRGDQFIIKHCFSMLKCKTTALKEGKRFLNFNPEHEAEIVTLPPELLQFQDNYSSQINIIDELNTDGAASGRSNTDEEGHSIYVRNLPLDANSRQLVKALKKFGPIKSVGIHTAFNNMSECCFADVEFESATSKQNAIEASPITIGGCLSVIEEKRGTGLTQGDSNRTNGGRNKFKNHGEDSRSKATSGGKDCRNRPCRSKGGRK